MNGIAKTLHNSRLRADFVIAVGGQPDDDFANVVLNRQCRYRFNVALAVGVLDDGQRARYDSQRVRHGYSNPHSAVINSQTTHCYTRG